MENTAQNGCSHVVLFVSLHTNFQSVRIEDVLDVVVINFTNCYIIDIVAGTMPSFL